VMDKKRGKFIVLYGINNLGKTTQAKLLVERLSEAGRKTRYLKYGVYDLVPSGVLLNEYLRKDNPKHLSPREFQMIHSLNRTQYEPKLLKDLHEGFDVVAEDYYGTGLAWGEGAGVEKDFLKYVNSHLLPADLSLLFDGQRFKDGLEKNHAHESDDALTEKVRQIHLRLAEEYGWKIIKANQSIEKVSDDVWQEVKKIL
jgi:dTMP kinase